MKIWEALLIGLSLIAIGQTVTAQSILIGSNECFVGDNVDIPVMVNVTNVAGINFTLSYNPYIVSLVNVSVNDSVSDQLLNIWNVTDNENGTLDVVMIFNATSLNNETILNLNFKALHSGISYLNVTGAEYANNRTDTAPPPYSFRDVYNGSITVKALEGLEITPKSLDITLKPGETYNESKTVSVGKGFAPYVSLEVFGEDWITFDPPEYINVQGPTTLNFNISIRVPEGTPAGTYHFKVRAVAYDEDWNPIAYSENQTINVTVPELPDLVGYLHVYNEFGNETWNLKIHKAGDSWKGNVYNYPFIVLNVTFEIRNLNPNATVDKIFKVSGIYKNNQLSYELTEEQLNDLNADGVLYISDETVVDASNINVGCYTFNVSVDSTNAVYESNESNNNASYTLCLSEPDLVPILQIPDEFNPGSHEFTVGVKNVGDVWAKATKLKFYINGTTSQSYEFNVPILMPNEVWTTNLTYQFEGGAYEIKVIADYNNSDLELNESNNTLIKMVEVAYRVVNASVITNVSEASYMNYLNASIVLDTEHPIGSFDLKLYYDYKLRYVSSFALKNVSISEDGWRYLNGRWFRVLDIVGNNLNLNGTNTVANVTFRVYTVNEHYALLNLSGSVRDVNGIQMLLNSTNATLHILRYTDIVPYIWDYPTYAIVGDNVTFKVTVYNRLKTVSNPFNLTVEIFNESNTLTKKWEAPIPPIQGWHYNVTEYTWTPEKAGRYYIMAKVYNDSNTANNVAHSYNITVKELTIDAWRIWYPWWEIRRNSPFYMIIYINSTAYVCGANITINVPNGLLIYNWTNRSWGNSVSYYSCLGDSKWNTRWFLVKGIKAGNYGNGTDNEINVTVKVKGRSDTLNTTTPKDPTDWIPDYPLVIYVPTITLYSINSTVLDNNTMSASMTFKTLDVNNVTTFRQNITIVVQAGQDGRILSGLDYLVHYPYGCVEQTTSKLLGALHTDEYYRSKGYPASYNREKVNKSIEIGVKSLAKGSWRGQHDNGSWSMWGWYQNGDAFYTMYASYGLGRVAEDDIYNYLVKGNLTDKHKASDAPGKFNFNDTIYWFNQTAIRDTRSINGKSVEVVYWKPVQWAHGFFEGNLPLTALIMVAHYQLVNEGLINNSAMNVANQTMAEATKYLISTQDEDGGWNQWGDPSKSSDALSTALAVWGLKLYGTPSSDVNETQIEKAINRGINWLLTHYYVKDPTRIYWKHPLQSPWWDNYGRQSEATAYALIAMNESRSMFLNPSNFTVLGSDNVTISKAVNYLVSVYRAHGSFGYTAATQVALHALTLLQAAAIEPITANITIDGVVTRQVTVNATNPRVVIKLTKDEINLINGNGTPQDSKRKIHTVEIQKNGSGLLIVSIENKQVVARDEVTYGSEYEGHRILSLNGLKGGTILIKSIDSNVLAEDQNTLTITPILPDNMVSGKSYEIKINITNNNDTAVVSPIVKVTLTGAEFDNNVTPKWFDGSWHSFTNANMNVTSNNTVEFYPVQVPSKGYIVVVFNATVNEDSSNVTVDVSVTPMYAETLTFVNSMSKSVKGYGYVNLKVYDINGTTIKDAKIMMDGANATTTIKAIEGSHMIRVEKNGYMPVVFNVDLARGDNVTYTVVLAKPEELDKPKVIFAEASSFADLTNKMSILSDTGLIKPNATVKAHRVFSLSVTGDGEKVIAVRVPKLVRGNLWAWLNDSIKIDVNGQTVTPEKVKIGDEEVLLIKVNRSASVNVSFEGRQLGDAYKDSRVNYKDAIAILQYAVFKNTTISKDLFTGNAVYGDVYEDGRVNYKDAIGVLQYAVFKVTDVSIDLWT